MVDESGQTLQKIVQSVEEVRDSVAGIATAGQQQSDGIQKVNDSILTMREITRKNSSVVDKAAEAGQRMGEKSRSLRRLMDTFSVNGKAV